MCVCACVCEAAKGKTNDSQRYALKYKSFSTLSFLLIMNEEKKSEFASLVINGKWNL